jgi:hypothetical protein
MLLSFVAFIFIFVVVQRSPWAHQNVYVQLPLSHSSSRPNLSSIIGGLNNDRLQAQLEDAWRHVMPAPRPSAVDAQLVAGGAEAGAPIVSIGDAKPTESHPPWVTAPSRTESVAATFARPTNVKKYMKSMLKWGRPTWDGHWPPFADYIDKEYDPNRWEEFNLLVACHAWIQSRC